MKQLPQFLTALLSFVVLPACTLAAPEDDTPKAAVHAAPNGKQFPKHWGAPPLIQTRDIRPLPGGYGHGSSTLEKWIQGKLAADLAANPRNTETIEAEIRWTETEITRITQFMQRARLTKEGLAAKNRELAALKLEQKELKTELAEAKYKKMPTDRKPLSKEFRSRYADGTYSTERLLVGLTPGLKKKTIAEIFEKQLPDSKIDNLMMDNTILVLTIPETMNVEQSIKKLSSDTAKKAGITYVELDRKVSIH